MVRVSSIMYNDFITILNENTLYNSNNKHLYISRIKECTIDIT